MRAKHAQHCTVWLLHWTFRLRALVSQTPCDMLNLYRCTNQNRVAKYGLHMECRVIPDVKTAMALDSMAPKLDIILGISNCLASASADSLYPTVVWLDCAVSVHHASLAESETFVGGDVWCWSWHADDKQSHAKSSLAMLHTLNARHGTTQKMVVLLVVQDIS